MATHDNITDLTVESVSECLDAAKLLIDHRKEDGGMMGYAATLLLFSVTDAIGHHLNAGSGHTRLDVLNSPEFGLHLSPQQIYEMKKWYRNCMVHNASIVPGVFLMPEVEGDPFDFENGKPVKIRVPQFYKLVRKVWDDLDRTSFNPLKDTLATKGYVEPPPLTSPLIGSEVALAATASGMTHVATVPPVSGAVTTVTAPSSGMHVDPLDRK
jgi:hypothetical protein